MATRLGLTATPRKFGIRVASAAFLGWGGIATATFDTGSTFTSAALTSDGTSTAAFGGASTAAGSYDILGRGIPALAGGSRADTAFSASGTSTFSYHPFHRATSLSLTATPGKSRTIPSRISVGQRLLQVNDSLGIDIDIADFFDRYWAVGDELNAQFVDTTILNGAHFLAPGSSSVLWGGGRNVAVAWTADGTSSVAWDAQTVITLSSDWTASGVATATFQGTSVGSTFSLGALSVQALSTFAPQGAARFSSSPVIAGTSTVSFATEVLYSSAWTISGTSTVEFASVQGISFTAAGSSTAVFASARTIESQFIGGGGSSVFWFTSAFGGEITAPAMQFDVTSGAMTFEVEQPLAMQFDIA